MTVALVGYLIGKDVEIVVWMWTRKKRRIFQLPQRNVHRIGY